MKLFKFLFLITIFLFVSSVNAQEPTLSLDTVEYLKAEVVRIIESKNEPLPGIDIPNMNQSIEARILEGEKEGEIINVSDNHLKLQEGDIFYLMHTENKLDGTDYYSVAEPYRLPWIIFFVILFFVCVLFFGGVQGVRGVLALAGSLLLILYVLLPGILSGYSPILTSLGVSALIITVGSYITHGFNRTTSSAVVGMIITVIITGLLAYFAVDSAKLTGFTDDAAIYLNFDTRGSIDFVGLLLGGILIGLLGVLYDVAIGQAISVEELHRIAPHIGRKTIFKRALRIGREHIGALVNTLAIAYVGVSLPLLLLYIHSSSTPILFTINREIFATEIIRTMIGSIGLVIAVPITTFIAVWMLMKDSKSASLSTDLVKEKEALEHFGHHH